MYKEKSTLIIIVLFNPNIDDIVTNIAKLNKQPNTVFLVDNGSNNISEIQEIVNTLQNTILVKYSQNKGLAAAQNEGLKYAIQNDFEFVCFFDQDTIVPINFAESMRKQFITLQNQIGENKIGILAPNYYDYGIHEKAHFARLTKHNYVDCKFEGKESCLSVSFVVSSGSFLRVKTVKQVGLLRSDFFIDQVDTEYSLRILEHGYLILVTPKVVLKHTIGHRKKKHFLGFIIKPNYHSAIRKYYIFRNGKVVVKLYKKQFPGIKVLMFKRFVHDFLGVVLYEQDKGKKISAMFKGLRDSKKLY